jgi:prefoldin subunit 5
MSKPDDIPTRLQQIQRRFEASYYVDNSAESAVEDLLAEVSRLREALADVKDMREDLAAEVSRLQQENALLRRSLEMLTKQLKDYEGMMQAVKDFSKTFGL